MKKIKLLLICMLPGLISQGQFNMPPFKEVVSTFFSTYFFEHLENYLKFYRQKDGWYIAQDSYTDPGHYFKEEKFWSVQSQSYLDVNYPPSDGDSLSFASQMDNYKRTTDWEYESYQFRLNKYYGYPGWDWDVIMDSTDLQSGVDASLESQGRACSNYASGFIAEQFGDLFVNNDPDRINLKASDPVSKTRIHKFIYYELKAIDAYKKLMHINPDYETRVGNIKVKCANEYLFMYCDLMMAGDSLSAVSAAKQADYPDSLLLKARSYLSAVPLNSILITGGDNDTYPLWYLQEIEQFRRDVVVLNYNLIGFRRYLSMIDRKYKHTLFSTTDTVYLKENFEYSIFANDKEDSLELSVDRFQKDLTSNYNPYDSTVYFYRNEVIKKYYARNLYFEKSRLNPKKTVRLKNYLLINEYILLDLVNSNSVRPIYTTFEVELLKGLLNKTGVVYKVEL